MTKEDLNEFVEKVHLRCDKCFNKEYELYGFTYNKFKLNVDLKTVDGVCTMTAECPICGFTEKQVFKLDEV